MSNESEIKLVPNDEPGVQFLDNEIMLVSDNFLSEYAINVNEPWHGTLGGYTNHGCRKECCKKAHRDYMKRRRVERMRLLEANPDIVEHGKFSTYTNWMCRCKPCCAAEKARRK